MSSTFCIVTSSVHMYKSVPNFNDLQRIQEDFENFAGNEDSVGYQQFLLFPQWFFIFLHFLLFSQIYFSLKRQIPPNELN